MDKRGQGTIEYLVIIAIVVVIALVVVSLLLGLANPGTQVTQTSSKISGNTQVVGVSNTIAGKDGNALVTLTNNSGGLITPLTIRIGSVGATIHTLAATSISQGATQVYRIPGMGVCSSVQSMDVTITYKSANDLNQSVVVSGMAFPCETTVTATNAIQVTN